MIDEPDNPDELPVDDWAMSEPEVPTDLESEMKPVDEAAAKLYSPPDTGDLKDWDIATKDLGLIESPEESPATAAPSAFDGPGPYEPPHLTFEILKPLVIENDIAPDWGMDQTAGDGWKMPDPVFRKSDGNSSLGKRAGAASETLEDPESEQNPENLSDIYSPPEKDEFTENENAFASEEMQISLVDEADPVVVTEDLPELATATFSVTETKPRRKRWSILLWIVIIGLLLFTTLAIGVFVFFYYSTRH